MSLSGAEVGSLLCHRDWNAAVLRCGCVVCICTVSLTADIVITLYSNVASKFFSKNASKSKPGRLNVAREIVVSNFCSFAHWWLKAWLHKRPRASRGWKLSNQQVHAAVQRSWAKGGRESRRWWMRKKSKSYITLLAATSTIVNKNCCVKYKNVADIVYFPLHFVPQCFVTSMGEKKTLGLTRLKHPRLGLHFGINVFCMWMNGNGSWRDSQIN